MSDLPRPEVPRAEIPWFPTIDPEKCVGCGTCYQSCPNGVYTWDEAQNHPVVTNPYQCVVLCESCAKMCPAGAISFPSRKDIIELLRALRSRAAAS